LEKDGFMVAKAKLAIGFLLVAVAQPYVYADTSENGLDLNGLTLNGLTLNGLDLNGLDLNGLDLNGLDLNGLDLNGLELQTTEVVLNPLVSLAAEPLTK
jgi:uncharacterized protein YjbI with pentapeptide repeats